MGDHHSLPSLRASCTSVSTFVGTGKEEATACPPQRENRSAWEHSRARQTGLMLRLLGCGSESWLY